MSDNKEIGKLGEDLATKYLETLGYQIIERNFRCKVGEIDIIAKDKDEVVFIEVKSRKILSYGKPGDAVDRIKRKHIYRAAEYYLLIHNGLDIYTRIDVIEVYLNKEKYRINHIKKAVIDRTQEPNITNHINYMQGE